MAAAFETTGYQSKAGFGTVSMFSYFKPLRRKIGVVTLVLACFVVAVWATSLKWGPPYVQIFLSTNESSFYLQGVVSVFASIPDFRFTWQIPFWIVLLPLTLLSAWLLVSSPRISKSKKTPEA